MEKIALVFPGQGSQYVGMFKSLCEQFDVARITFEDASDVLGIDMKKLCFESSLFEISKTENALISIFTASIAAFRIYMQEVGIAPQYCAGHSLGEYSALTCSGAIRFEDALKIVHRRAQIAQQVADNGIGDMTIIDNIMYDAVEQICWEISADANRVSISCYNARNQVAISGHQDAVRKVEDKVLELGGNVTPLYGNAPFHCSLMNEFAEILKEELVKYKFQHLRWPVISNVTALPYKDFTQITNSLVMHLKSPVQWMGTMDYLKNHGITLAIELGPKNVLTKLFKQDHEDIVAMAYDQRASSEAIKDLLTKDNTIKKYKANVVTKCLAISTSTPNYCFNNDEYEEGVIKPYRELEAIQNDLDNSGEEPSCEQMHRALMLLKTILKTKKIPLDEQNERFTEIFEETGTWHLFREYDSETITF